MKINAIVQARMGSTRFPGKVMAKVAGKPLIGHLLDRLWTAADVDRLVVAIPGADRDSTLKNYVEDYGADLVVWGGPENNVADRFCSALQAFPCDAFIRICGDSPLVDAKIVNGVADALRRGVQYIHGTAGIPGTQVQGIQTGLFLSYVEEFNEYDQEHVLSYFTRHLAMVVDTPEDLERLRPALEQNMGYNQWMSHILPA